MRSVAKHTTSVVALFRVLCVFATSLVAWAPARAEVWGVKTHDPESGPPATLFHFAEDGSSFVAVAPVTLGGTEIDVDGLAVRTDGSLFGFQLDAGGSRLISINPATAAAQAIGSTLAGRDIRGASFTRSGALLVLDSAQEQLLQINPADGSVIGQPVRLTQGGNPYPDLSNLTDIAERGDGTLFVCDYSGLTGAKVFTLNSSTGALTTLFTDTDDIGLVGAAFSASSADPTILFALDVFESEELLTYQSEAPHARSTLYPGIIPEYNAGRGDLAAAPVPEPQTWAHGVALFASVGALCLLRRQYACRRHSV